MRKAISGLMIICLLTSVQPVYAFGDGPMIIAFHKALDEVNQKIQTSRFIQQTKAMYEQLTALRDQANRITQLGDTIKGKFEDMKNGNISLNQVMKKESINGLKGQIESVLSDVSMIGLTREQKIDKVLAECIEKASQLPENKTNGKTADSMRDNCRAASIDIVHKQETIDNQKSEQTERFKTKAEQDAKRNVAVAAAEAAAMVKGNIADVGANRLSSTSNQSFNTQTIAALSSVVGKDKNGKTNIQDLSQFLTPPITIDGRNYMAYGSQVIDKKTKKPIDVLNPQKAILLAQILVGAQPQALPAGDDLTKLNIDPSLMVKRFSKFTRDQLAMGIVLRQYDQVSNDTFTDEFKNNNSLALTGLENANKIPVGDERNSALLTVIVKQLLITNEQLFAMRRSQWEQNALLSLIMTGNGPSVNVAAGGSNGSSGTAVSNGVTQPVIVPH